MSLKENDIEVIYNDDSIVKRSLSVYFMKTVYVYSTFVELIRFRPAEDTAYILSNIFIYFTLAKKNKPAGMLLITDHILRNILIGYDIYGG